MKLTTAKYLDIILYSREQIIKENKATNTPNLEEDKGMFPIKKKIKNQMFLGVLYPLKHKIKIMNYQWHLLQ